MKTRKLFLMMALGTLVFLTALNFNALALPGGGAWNSGLKVQNLDVGSAQISVDLYSSAGGAPVYSITKTPDGLTDLIAPEGGSVEVYFPNYTSLPAGQYSAVVSSTKNVGAIATNTNYGLGLADSYVAPFIASPKYYIPYVYHNHNSWSTEIFVQNTTSNPVTVNVLISNGTVSKTCTLSLSGMGSGSCDTSKSPDFDVLGAGFIGYATIDSSSVEVAVMVNQIRLAGNSDVPGNLMVSHRSLVDADASNKVVLPSLYKNFNNWKTGIKLQNLNPTAATVTVVFTSDTDAPTAGWSGTKTGLSVPGNGSTEIYLPTNGILDAGASIPDLFKGSAVVTATSGTVLSNAIQTNYAAGNGVAIGYIGATQGTSKVSLPTLYRWPSGAGIWVSGIKIQNLGDSAVTVVVNFFTDPDIGGGSPGNTTGLTLGIGEAKELYLANNILDGNLAIQAPWKGSALITATGGTTPQISATAISTNYGRHGATMYSGINN
jgi:hypothetical protein